MTVDDFITNDKQDLIIAAIRHLNGQMPKAKLFDIIKSLFVKSDRHYWANNNEIANELAAEAAQEFINKTHGNNKRIVEIIGDNGTTYLYIDPTTTATASVAAMPPPLMGVAAAPPQYYPQQAPAITMGMPYMMLPDDSGGNQQQQQDEEDCSMMADDDGEERFMTADECLTRTEQDLVLAMIAQWEQGMPKQMLFDIVKQFIVMPDPQYYRARASNDATTELANEATQDFLNIHRNSIVERVAKDGTVFLFVDPELVRGSPAAHQAARIARGETGEESAAAATFF